MKSFIKEAFQSIKTSGTLQPSSRFLIKDCLKRIDFSQCQTLVEFGPGDGCFTKTLSSKISADSHLYAFEINPTFYQYCKRSFSAHKNVEILNKSAFDFHLFLKEKEIEQVDYFISSLPLTLFKKTTISRFLLHSYRYLKKGGFFIQYQYSLGNYRQLKKIFDTVDIDLTVRNLPPAFIYICHKS